MPRCSVLCRPRISASQSSSIVCGCGRPREIIRGHRRAKRPGLKISDLLQQLRRGVATQPLKVSNHVHLIEVPELVGNAHPGSVRCNALCVHRQLKSSHSGEQLGTHASLFSKQPVVMSNAQATLLRNVFYSRHPVEIKKVLGAFHDGSRSKCCLLYTSPSPRDGLLSRMPS